METTFYIAAAVAVVTTLRVITCSNAVHALLYLIVSLLSVAVIFYVLGAAFAAAMEVIIYAGAIMVLFVFVVMMLNLGSASVAQEQRWSAPRYWIGPGILASVLFIVVVLSLVAGTGMGKLDTSPVFAVQVGMLMFGPYVLVVELAVFILLAALVVAAHLGREEKEPAHTPTGHKQVSTAR